MGVGCSSLCDLERSIEFKRKRSESLTETSKWKEKLTKQKAKELYEKDGSIPKNSNDELVEFRVFLADQLLLRQFGEYARDMKRLEILMCWADILEFKDIRTEQLEYQISFAQYIYNKYLSVTAIVVLNGITVPDNYRSEIMGQIEHAKEENIGLTVHLFDIFHQECLVVLCSELYKPYKQTPLYASSVGAIKNVYNQVKPDDFEYFDELGFGSFGFVVRCKKKSTGIMYAMKIQMKLGLLECFSDCPSRVVYEKEAVAACHHPFIVSMDYSFQTRSLVMMAMDLGTEGTLSDALSYCENNRMPEERVRFYAAEIMLTLAHIHRMGMIYRDLKPQNVLLMADGHIKLVDMGMKSHLFSNVY